MIKVQTVRVLRKAKLPVGNSEIDLYKAFNDLKDCGFELRYDPACGFKALYIKVDGLAFIVFANGTVMVYGKMPMKKQGEILDSFWKQHLHKFVSKPQFVCVASLLIISWIKSFFP